MFTEKDEKIVDVLGTKYKIHFVPEDSEVMDSKHSDGFIDESTKEIYISIFKPDDTSLNDLFYHQRQVIRHEIIHAFMFESGLAQCSCGVNAWAQNEEMIDYFARMHNKIHSAFIEAGALQNA